MGGLLVTLAALVTFVAHSAATTGPSATVVVATRPVAAGNRLTAADLRSVAADLPGSVLDTLFSSASELDGAVALTALDPDQTIARTAVRRLGADDEPATHDLAFSLERERALSGRLQPGEHVDLLATFGAGADARTEVVVRGVRVVAVDAPSTSSAAPTAKVTLTLAFSTEADLLRAANALEVAKVAISRSTGRPGPTAGEGDGRPPPGRPAGDPPAAASTSPTSAPATTSTSSPTTAPAAAGVEATEPTAATDPTATEPRPPASEVVGP